MTKAILVYSPISPPNFQQQNWANHTLDEMNEYCRRQGYIVSGAYSSTSNLLFYKDSASTKLALELCKAGEEVVIVSAGNLSHGVKGELIPVLIEEYLKLKQIRIESVWHPCFPYPSVDDNRIWRYMDLPKFLDLIQSKKLHFTRSDELRRSEPHEGKLHTKRMSAHLDQIENGTIPSPFDGMNGQEFVKYQRDFARDSSLPAWHFINCWHISEIENFAMWKVYAERFGLCVESKIGRLKSCFKDEKWSYYHPLNKIYIGKVTYYDDNTDFIPGGNSFWPHMHKRNEFSYERELRCMIMDPVEPVSIRPIVDLDTLVTAIHISPFAPDWYTDVVKTLCEKFGIKKDLVVRSALSTG